MSNVCFSNTKYNIVVDKIFKEDEKKISVLYTICVYFLYTICNCTCCLQVKLINLQLHSTYNEGQCNAHGILLHVLIGSFKMNTDI